MAIFQHPNDYQRLDYSLLLNGPITLYYRPEFLAEDAAWLEDHGYRLDHFDCSAWDSESVMLEAIAQGLAFPDYFGRNLDALNDCLGDIEIPEEGGRVLIFHRYDLFARRMPQVAWIILDIIADNARRHLLFGRRLMALAQSNDPDLFIEPVGACSVDWNRREWLKNSRG